MHVFAQIDLQKNKSSLLFSLNVDTFDLHQNRKFKLKAEPNLPPSINKMSEYKLKPMLFLSILV